MDSIITYITNNLTTEVFGNTVQEYGIALGIFIGLIFAYKIVEWIVIQRLEALSKKTTNDLDDVAVRIVRSIRPYTYFFVSLFIAAQSLTLPSLGTKILTALVLFVGVAQVISSVGILIDYIVTKRFLKDAEDENIETRAAVGFIRTIIVGILWVLGGLMILSNLGVEVTSLVAGLGIGGLAIAFALQEILADLFSSFAIYFDRPFKVGDYIMIGTDGGTVEKVGIKTTRLRTLQGEELVVSNRELTTARVQNFHKMEERRATFTFGVLYETPAAQLRAIPKMVTDIFAKTQNVRLDRVHFTTLNDSSLDFEVVYHVASRDVQLYRDIQQDINLALIEQFEKEKIGFAYPTRTLYINKEA